MGPRELARNAEPPWPSPARRALARAAPLASSGAPRPFCCPGEGGVGHANGFSFLSARTTPCIDALRACLSSPRPNQQARVPHGGLSLRPARSLPPVERLCKLTSGGPTSSRMYCPLRRLTTPALRPFHRCLSHVLPSPSKDHHEAPPPLRAVPRLHRGDPPPLFGLRLPLREEGALGLGRPRHHPQRAPRGVVLEGPGRGTSKRVVGDHTPT